MPQLGLNLLSAKSLTQKGASIFMKGNNVSIKDNVGIEVPSGTQGGPLFQISSTSIFANPNDVQKVNIMMENQFSLFQTDVELCMLAKTDILS